MSYGCKKGVLSVLDALLALGRRFKEHHSLFLVIANENERLALLSSSHPCSSVLSGFPKESAALPNTSPSPAIPAGIPAASSAGQTGAAVGVNPGLQQHLALLVFHSHSARPATFPARTAPAFS